jgi:hypothetical protein
MNEVSTQNPAQRRPGGLENANLPVKPILSGNPAGGNRSLNDVEVPRQEIIDLFHGVISDVLDDV